LAVSGSVTIACTKGATGVTIGLDNGLYALSTQRYMHGASHGDSLAYNLFQDSAHATLWDNSTHKFSVAAPTSKASQVLSIYGVIPKNQDISTDSYSDTVTATINY
jgi:spore coat protein U-like protein